ncbi:serine/arginine-rich SC35-like splicing factor SCL33 [Impatiens glandulifera]|uniref:serine/arginine-rich SC35-like splicing factor SCL33 n=1 Tax=Impatiens glandulifera TaxID=253017 RepID=UPI001FB08F5B|nr:serine/arginine-rich SC35-like splicing factor SCL33 [Impatiens glandulifera]
MNCGGWLRLKPQGFGYINYARPADAAEAKNHMHGQVILGQPLTVIHADERKSSVRASIEMSSRSHCPSPPRGRSGGGGGRDRDPNHSSRLFVRNLHPSCGEEDLRKPFEQFGPIKRVYFPRSRITEYDSCFNEDHQCFTGYPQRFGYIEYERLADAAEAKIQMHGVVLLGRPLTVLHAEEKRGRPNHRKPAPLPRDPPSPRRSRYLPRRQRSPSRSHEGYSPPPKKGGQHSRSVSPRENRTNGRESDISYLPNLNSRREHYRAGRNPEQSPSPKYEKSRVKGGEIGVSPSSHWKCQPESNGRDKMEKPDSLRILQIYD